MYTVISRKTMRSMQIILSINNLRTFIQIEHLPILSLSLPLSLTDRLLSFLFSSCQKPRVDIFCRHEKTNRSSDGRFTESGLGIRSSSLDSLRAGSKQVQ